MTLDIPGTPEKNPKETKKSGNSRDSAFNTFHTRTQTHVPPSTQELQLNLKSAPISKTTPSAKAQRTNASFCSISVKERKNVQPPGSYLSSWSPRVASVRLHHLLQRVRHRSREAKQLLREGSTEGRGGQPPRSPLRRGHALLTKHLVKGKRMFCNLGLEFPEAEQEMSTGARSSREKARRSPFSVELSGAALSGVSSSV